VQQQQQPSGHVLRSGWPALANPLLQHILRQVQQTARKGKLLEGSRHWSSLRQLRWVLWVP
jgi:hypothetical protein